MNKKVAIIKKHLRPGNPLIILGPYGCAKLEYTIFTIEKCSYKKYICYLGINEDPSIVSLRKWAKNIPGNGVLIIDAIEKASPAYIDFIIDQAKHPDRIMILVGRTLPPVLKEFNNIIRFVGEYPYELKE
jgi:hypothetical protein